MGNKKYTRRNFFRSLTPAPPATADAPFGDTEDPLFQKYSRKKLTTRTYSTEEAMLKVGTEDTDATARTGNPVTSGLTPYNGAWTEWEALHLIRRTNFGAKKAWVDALLGMTPSAAVDAVLNINPTPSAQPVNWHQNFYADESAITGNNNTTDNPIIGYGADWTNHYFASTTNAANTSTSSNGQNTNHYRMDGLRRWLFGLTVTGDVTIREKMVWFWYHLIPIDFESIYQSSNSYVVNNSARIFYRYMKLFRDYGTTGNFKALMKKVSLSPAMMFYLNNQANSVTAPDENYGRELMELFTLGKDPLRYTEDDVKAAARVLTGWRVNGMNTANVTTDMLLTNTTSGRKHDPNTKLFSSFFGNATIASSTTNTALWAGELDQLMDLIFGPSQAETVSRYICRRLYRFFVYYDIDANVEANVIVPLAQTFVSNNWDIQPVLSQLFKSQHFFDMANRGVYIKSPFDLVAGFVNSFSPALNATDATSTEYQYRIWGKFGNDYSLGMEQEMGSIPNVSGWNAFYQTPSYHQYWINSNTIQKRFKFISDQLSTTGYTISGLPTTRKFKVDPLLFAKQFGDAIAGNADLLIATCVKYLLPMDVSATVKAQFKTNNLLTGQANDQYWQTGWMAWSANDTAATRSPIESRMNSLLTAICQLADFQLM